MLVLINVVLNENITKILEKKVGLLLQILMVGFSGILDMAIFR